MVVPDKPAAEVVIDERLVRQLLREQADAVVPGLSQREIVPIAEGWDNAVWRADDLLVRLPRREAAAQLIRHEQRTLPEIGPGIEACGVRVPTPLVIGHPDATFGWPWSVVPWIGGERGMEVPHATRAGWVPRLAAALRALHRPAPANAPVNPVRGRPLATRDAAVRERLAALAGRVDDATRRTLVDAWDAGIAAAPWPGPAVWIHGDLHPGNLVADGDTLTGIIDFGDVTAGDPAYDLSIAWTGFDQAGRAALQASLDGVYDDATWTRARGWAASIATLLIVHSDDNPDYAALGHEAAREITR